MTAGCGRWEGKGAASGRWLPSGRVLLRRVSGEVSTEGEKKKDVPVEGYWPGVLVGL